MSSTRGSKGLKYEHKMFAPYIVIHKPGKVMKFMKVMNDYESYENYESWKDYENYERLWTHYKILRLALNSDRLKEEHKFAPSYIVFKSLWQTMKVMKGYESYERLWKLWSTMKD